MAWPQIDLPQDLSKSESRPPLRLLATLLFFVGFIALLVVIGQNAQTVWQLSRLIKSAAV